jgi:hypothetical protein
MLQVRNHPSSLPYIGCMRQQRPSPSGCCWMLLAAAGCGQRSSRLLLWGRVLRMTLLLLSCCPGAWVWAPCCWCIWVCWWGLITAAAAAAPAFALLVCECVKV